MDGERCFNMKGYHPPVATKVDDDASVALEREGRNNRECDRSLGG